MSYANNEGPDQTARIAQSDLGLRCSLTECMDIIESKDEFKRLD